MTQFDPIYGARLRNLEIPDEAMMFKEHNSHIADDFARSFNENHCQKSARTKYMCYSFTGRTKPVTAMICCYFNNICNGAQMLAKFGAFFGWFVLNIGEFKIEHSNADRNFDSFVFFSSLVRFSIYGYLPFYAQNSVMLERLEDIGGINGFEYGKPFSWKSLTYFGDFLKKLSTFWIFVLSARCRNVDRKIDVYSFRYSCHQACNRSNLINYVKILLLLRLCPTKSQNPMIVRPDSVTKSKMRW